MAYNLEQFIISEEVLGRLGENNVLASEFSEGKILQKIFGFSNETALLFYETAKNILEQKRAKDAINAFVFLTTLNPYVPSFWMGLGMAQQLNQEHNVALDSYNMALTLEGKQIFPYIVAAQCCIEIKDFDQATNLMELAEQYAAEHPEDEASAKLAEDARAAKAYVWEQKMRR
jgi:tetratricopeptide (TPR) repeat protein